MMSHDRFLPYLLAKRSGESSTKYSKKFERLYRIYTVATELVNFKLDLRSGAHHPSDTVLLAYFSYFKKCLEDLEASMFDQMVDIEIFEDKKMVSLSALSMLSDQFHAGVLESSEEGGEENSYGLARSFLVGQAEQDQDVLFGWYCADYFLMFALPDLHDDVLVALHLIFLAIFHSRYRDYFTEQVIIATGNKGVDQIELSVLEEIRRNSYQEAWFEVSQIDQIFSALYFLGLAKHQKASSSN